MLPVAVQVGARLSSSPFSLLPPCATIWAMARPFLKWAGGKGKLAPAILAAAPPAVSRYIEPFAGAGAVFFAFEEERPGVPAILADANRDLIETYTVVRDDPAGLDAGLAELAAVYHAADGDARRAMYYRIRSEVPGTPPQRAARFIFLNRTCYNGLYRVNASGGFNVPFGRYKNPRIHHPGLLASCSSALQRATLRVADFAEVCAEARPGDFVYLDPPYQPLSATASFTGYTRADFGAEDQRRLRDAFDDLSRRGVAAILSNSDHPVIRGLYEAPGNRLATVCMSRAINSVGSGRAAVPELLFDNFARVGLAPAAGRAD